MHGCPPGRDPCRPEYPGARSSPPGDPPQRIRTVWRRLRESHPGSRFCSPLHGLPAASVPVRYPADWLRYRLQAGLIPNRQMLDEGEPDQVIVFHSDLEQRRGTGDTVRAAPVPDVPVVVIRGAGVPPASLDHDPRSQAVAPAIPDLSS